MDSEFSTNTILGVHVQSGRIYRCELVMEGSGFYIADFLVGSSKTF